MTDIKGLEREGVEKHIPPILNCSYARLDGRFPVSSTDWLSRLERLLFPDDKITYPGRVKGFARLLGISPSYGQYLSKPSGRAKLTLPVARRAAKICADLIANLSVIREGLELDIKRMESRPKKFGMFKVMVRDASGVPKTGLWRDGWGRKK